MQYLENLITETKNKKAKENLLLLQKFANADYVDHNKKVFINSMMSLCGVNKCRYCTYFGSVMIGRASDDDAFESFLGSMVSEPVVVVGRYDDEPQIYIKNKYDIVTCFNLVDIQVKNVKVQEVGDGLIHYVFILHSQYSGMDYSLDMVLKEAK